MVKLITALCPLRPRRLKYPSGNWSLVNLDSNARFMPGKLVNDIRNKKNLQAELPL